MVQKIIEIVGISDESLDGAIRNAIDVSNKTVKNMKWFRVDSFEGEIKNGKAVQWRATVKIYFDVTKKDSE